MTFNRRKFALCGIWGLVAILAILTAENIYSGSRAADLLAKDVIYLAGNNTPASAIPAYGDEIIVWQGGDLPQMNSSYHGRRKISLFFRIASAPKTSSTFVATVNDTIKAWQLAGHKVGSVYIDYNAASVDKMTLSGFLEDLRKGVDGNHAINLALAPAQAQDAMMAIRENIYFLVFDLNDALAANQSPAAFVASLEDIQLPFYLIVDKSVDTVPFYKTHMQEAKFFAGFIVALGDGQTP